MEWGRVWRGGRGWGQKRSFGGWVCDEAFLLLLFVLLLLLLYSNLLSVYLVE